MNRQPGTIITIVVAVLTLCPSLFCCVFGVTTLAGGGSWSVMSEAGQIPPLAGIPILCLSFLVWLLPVGLWFFLARGKNGAQVAGGEAPDQYV